MNKNNESVLQWAIEYNDKKHVYDHPIATFSKHELIALYHALRSSEYIKVILRFIDYNMAEISHKECKKVM